MAFFEGASLGAVDAQELVRRLPVDRSAWSPSCQSFTEVATSASTATLNRSGSVASSQHPPRKGPAQESWTRTIAELARRRAACPLHAPLSYDRQTCLSGDLQLRTNRRPSRQNRSLNLRPASAGESWVGSISNTSSHGQRDSGALQPLLRGHHFGAQKLRTYNRHNSNQISICSDWLSSTE